ncbi:hypothetical protein [Streptomyces sp. NPDC003943]
METATQRNIWTDAGLDHNVIARLWAKSSDGLRSALAEQFQRLLSEDREDQNDTSWLWPKGDDYDVVCSFKRLRNLRQPLGTRDRLKAAAEDLRSANTVTERRAAVREFRAAFAEFVASLLRFLVRVLILLLSRMLGRAGADDVPVWKPDPIDAAPQITPRGPNLAFPVTTYRGGRRSSAQGSAVLVA